MYQEQYQPPNSGYGQSAGIAPKTVYSQQEIAGSNPELAQMKQGARSSWLNDDEVSDQMAFIRKVYAILAIQLVITAAAIFWV